MPRPQPAGAPLLSASSSLPPVCVGWGWLIVPRYFASVCIHPPFIRASSRVSEATTAASSQHRHRLLATRRACVLRLACAAIQASPIASQPASGRALDHRFDLIENRSKWNYTLQQGCVSKPAESRDFLAPLGCCSALCLGPEIREPDEPTSERASSSPAVGYRSIRHPSQPHALSSHRIGRLGSLGLRLNLGLTPPGS